MSAVSAEAGDGSLRTRINAILVAPGASDAESWLSYGAATVGACFGLVVGVVSESTPLQLAVLALLGFDLFGGAVVNATASAARRFHGARTSRRGQWGFVAAHVHLLGVAAVFPAYSWTTAVTLYAAVTLGAVVILLANEMLRRPTAFAVGALILSLVGITTASGVPVELSWIAPLLVIKLLLAHLVPWRPRERIESAAAARHPAAESGT